MAIWGSRLPPRTQCDRRFRRLRRTRQRSQQANDDHRYVVEAATFQRQLEHDLAGGLRAAAGSVLKNLVVTQMFGQTIAADHKDITRTGGPGDKFKLEVFANAYRTGN